MTYTPSTPANGAENISVSQPKITTNFEQLNVLYNRDHFAWNDLTSAKRGYHRQMSFPDALVADPAIGSFDGILYPKEDPNDTSARTQMFFSNTTAGGRVFQLTNRFYSPGTTSGFLMLPNGTDSNPSLILMWGVYTGAFNSSSSIPVDFPKMPNYSYVQASPDNKGFPNNCFNVQISLETNDHSTSPSKVCTIAQTPAFNRLGFSFNANNSFINKLYWFAIGN